MGGTVDTASALFAEKRCNPNCFARHSAHSLSKLGGPPQAHLRCRSAVPTDVKDGIGLIVAFG
jgi:hypothetical protein